MRPPARARREFLKLLGAGLLAGMAGPGSLAQVAGCARRSRRPNFLFVLTDDHAFDALGCAGHPWIRTPALDRIAHQGVRFSNTFVTLSLCSPSRASFLSGLYPHTHGVCSNDVNDLPPATPTFPRLLQQAGYTTAFIGKWHMARTSRPRPGFDHWVAFKGQGEYDRNTLNVDGRWEVARNYITDELTDRAVRFLGTTGDRPFLLMLSHKAVHEPFKPAPRHAHLYDDVRPERRIPLGDRLDLKPDWGGRAPGKIDWREFMLNYARTLAAVDEGMDRLVTALAKHGRLDDTVIIYAGDNGFMSGEHGGLWDKRVAYEPSIRIPLIVRYPRRFAPGTVCHGLALNIDIMPTILALAGVSGPGPLLGLNLADLAGGMATRDAFLYEYFRELPPVPTILAVRTERYKYITYPEDPQYTTELYDLRYDPDELINRAGEAEFRDVVTGLAARLEALKAATGFRMMTRVAR